MKLSLNWLKRYLHINHSPEKIAEHLTTIGLEVEGIERVESIKGGLKGVVIGEVLTCDKHPDADKLSLTTVNAGTGETLQIVCGAPNVAAGQKVLVATVGTTLYDAEGKPWTIKNGKIRGQESNGMLCAADELGLGVDHSGIVVLPSEVQVGTTASTYYNVEDDFVLEIGLTPNRSDATSQLGVARDLLAYLRVHEDYQDDIIEPDASNFVTEKVRLNIEAELQRPDIVRRYSGVTLTNVKVQESPEWLKKLLHAIGVKSINNVVDITNYILNEYGQPLHAFDADKIKGGKIVVRNLEDGAMFKALDNNEKKLSATDVMICDIEGNGLCIGGVYGGLESGVTSETKNVFLEAATFHSTAIRRTSTRLNLRTDAAKVFEKGADPNITITALKRAAALIKNLTQCEISNIMVDIYPHPIPMPEVRLKYSRIYEHIGMEIEEDKIHNILQAMDMEITPVDHESILVKIPTNKADVLRDVDLIEEIVRIFGLNNVRMPDKISSTISYTEKPVKHRVKETIADFLAANGYNEMMGLSLIESKYYAKSGLDPQSFVYINNTSNIHLDIMRPDMLVSGLVSVAHNINRQQANLRLFEFGKSYLRMEKDFLEKEILTLFSTGKRNEESWRVDYKSDKDYFDIKQAVMSVLQRCGLAQYQMAEIIDDARWAYGLKIHQGPLTIAEFGQVSPSITAAVGIKVPVYYAELAFAELLRVVSKAKTVVTEISKFPSVRRDLALVIDKKVSFADIEQIARQTDKKLLKQISLFDVFDDESKLGSGKKSYAVSFVFEDLEKTLKDTDIEVIMNKLTDNFVSKAGAIIRK
jgi:phenylalanyl-tRNA synthetase beta chain